MFKKFFCAIFTIITIFSIFSLNVFAEDNQLYDGYIVDTPPIEDIQIGSFPNSENSEISPLWLANDYSFVGKKTYWGVIRNYDYLCYKDTANSWYAMLGMNLTSAVYHSKNSGDKALSFSVSQTYSIETASEFSVGVGGEAGVGDMVKASVALGCGRSQTVGKSFQVSSTIQATIPASSKTGYYKMQVCHNFYKMKITRQRTDGTYPETQLLKMPYGEPYAAVLYSSTNTTGSWARW